MNSYNFHLEIRDYFHDLAVPFDWIDEKVVPKNMNDIEKVLSYMELHIKGASEEEDRIFLQTVYNHIQAIKL